MKIVHPEYFDVISISEDTPETLVVENSVYFREIVDSILFQKNTEVGDYVVSDHNEILSFSKSCLLITDIYNYYENDRQLKTKIQNMVLNEAQYSDKPRHLLADLNDYAIDMANTIPYSVKFKENITITDLIKFFDYSLDLSNFDFWERLLEYMKICKEQLNYKLVITVNLKDSISTEEYTEFIKYVADNKICLLMIERNIHDNLDETGHIRIVDSDLCVI